MWNKSLMWNSPKMWNRPKEVEQAQRGGTGPKINHTCSLADLASLGQRSSLRSAPRFAGQLLKKGGTHEMWNKSLMWNSPKMWSRPKEVEQAQRSTIPFQQGWDRPKGTSGETFRCPNMMILIYHIYSIYSIYGMCSMHSIYSIYSVYSRYSVYSIYNI